MNENIMQVLLSSRYFWEPLTEQSESGPEWFGISVVSKRGRGWLSGRCCEFLASSSTVLLPFSWSWTGANLAIGLGNQHPEGNNLKTPEYLSERGLCPQKAKNSPLGTATLLSKPAERR